MTVSCVGITSSILFLNCHLQICPLRIAITSRDDIGKLNTIASRSFKTILSGSFPNKQMSRRYPPPSPALSSASSRSLLSWLEGVEPYDSGSLDATRDKRKLDSTDFATDGKVEFKRRQSARIRDQQIGRVRRPLAKTSGNIMVCASGS